MCVDQNNKWGLIIAGNPKLSLGLLVEERLIDYKILTTAMQNKIREHTYNRFDDNANFRCYDYATKGAISAAKLKHSNATLEDWEKAIAVAKYYGADNIMRKYPDGEVWYSQQGDIEVHQDSVKNALNYIRKAIDSDYPVVAGVNVQFHTGRKNFGEITDHFVVIVGYVAEGTMIKKLFAIDPAGKDGLDIDFDIDTETWKISKDGVFDERYTSPNPYQLDHVRVWVGLKPDNLDGVRELHKDSPRRN
jgi:hypothetical protein